MITSRKRKSLKETPADSKRRRKSLDNVVKRVNAMSVQDFAQAYMPISRLQCDCTSHDEHASLKFKIKMKQPPAYSTAHFCEDYIVTPAELQSCLDLVQTTSRTDYEQSSLGWHPKTKTREMRHVDMRFLLLYQMPDDRLVGFLSFMTTFEDGSPVLYIYEIHLDESVRGCGLGRHLVQLVEHLAAQVDLVKVMLTVFRSNQKARSWYSALGFVVDPYTPADRILRDGKVKQSDILILSKPADTSTCPTVD